MKAKIRPATSPDLAQINEIYNYYVLKTNATFDIEPWSIEKRRSWYKAFNNNSLYYLLVAEWQEQVVGFAYNAQFKERAAYQTSSEVTIYIKPDSTGLGIGYKLYHQLFNLISQMPIHRLYAAITLPNMNSIKLLEKANQTS
ncbi:N-acetyltransferase [Endozoicomonas sp. SM1973]|uniref:N-acetyltransferase n=1 Tax=Spartinivicinus marinus TaxID=2994442 RepID=A0A853I6I5_9GAMM|nr:GNAT family N-acetyltransferase [Spartinivicinus marinus]MCX4024695.1 GNAT family N-acetyltransferase [Spartinivicinus marinus]NYZ66278.1 N-acetyltransferase [Spartinivicinus marinus]